MTTETLPSVSPETVTPAWRKWASDYRTVGRIAEYGYQPSDEGPIPGGCLWMAETIAMEFGWQENGGCYVTPAGHIDHMWNELPDGSILDATADQFGEADTPADGIRVLPGDDPRYDSRCLCTDQIG